MRRQAALLAAIGVLVSACGEDDPNADAVREDGSVDLSKVTLVVGDQKGGSKAILEAAGELKDVPYEIDWKEFTSGPPLLEAVGSGAVDIGRVGNTPPLFAIDQGKNLKAIAMDEVGAKGDAIVVPEGSDIKSVADLEGKKVAVAKGSSANFNLLAQLDEVGLDFDDIDPSYLQPADGLAAFQGGSVDAWAIWDPYTAQAEVDEGAQVIATGPGIVNGYEFQVAGDDAIDSEATDAALRDYIARLARAKRWSADNREEWAEVWAEETGLSVEVTEHSVRRRDFKPRPIDESAVESEQEMWDAFKDAGQIESDAELSSYFVDDYNEVVDADEPKPSNPDTKDAEKKVR